VYTAQWPLSATGEVVQHVSESAVSVLILCHFLVNWENLLELIMIGSPWLLGSGVELAPAALPFMQLLGDKAMTLVHALLAAKVD